MGRLNDARMGFSVTIDRNSEAVLTRLQSSPHEVFDRPYAGYLLFLLGGADRRALAWFGRHAVALDSLTGEHVAFATFARRLDIRLRTGEARPGGERREHTVALDRLRGISVQQLVKRGSLGMVYDGDLLSAMTYAVDDIARALGVLDQLPCVVVLDAVPRQEFSTLRLDSSTLPELLQFLRATMHELLEDANLQTYLAQLEHLASLDREIERAEHRGRDWASRIPEAPDESELATAVDETLAKARSLLASGALARFSEGLDSLHFEQLEVDAAAAAARTRGDALRRSSLTAGTLEYYSRDRVWPLSEDDAAKYRNVLTKHVAALLPGRAFEGRTDAAAECSSLASSLRGMNDVLVSEVMDMLPHAAVVVSRVFAEASRQYRENAERRARGEERRRALPALREAAIRECLSEDAPSLCKIVDAAARAKHLRVKRGELKSAALQTLAGAATEVGKPGFWLKLWQAVGAA